MLPADQGRFCNHCQQEIIDFSKMSDAEILRVLDQPNAPKCGRWHKSQLNRALQPAAHSENRIWPRLAVGAMLCFAAMPHALLAQLPQSNTEISLKPNKSEKSNLEPNEDGFKILSGVVRDEHSMEPLSFATIKIKDQQIGCFADEDGQFKLKIPIDRVGAFFDLEVYYDGQVFYEKRIMMNEIPENLEILRTSLDDISIGIIIQEPSRAEKRKAKKAERLNR